MNLENIMLRSQSQRPYVVLFHLDEISRIDAFVEIGHSSMVAREGDKEGNGEGLAMGVGFFLG